MDRNPHTAPSAADAYAVLAARAFANQASQAMPGAYDAALDAWLNAFYEALDAHGMDPSDTDARDNEEAFLSGVSPSAHADALADDA